MTLTSQPDIPTVQPASLYRRQSNQNPSPSGMMTRVRSGGSESGTDVVLMWY